MKTTHRPFMHPALPYWTVLLLGIIAASTNAVLSAAAALALLTASLVWGGRKGG